MTVNVWNRFLIYDFYENVLIFCIDFQDFYK